MEYNLKNSWKFIFKSLHSFFVNYSIVIVAILAFCKLGYKYIDLSSRDIVFMDFWRNIVTLIPPVMEDDFNLQLLWSSNLGQRNPLQLALIALNIKYFDLNCLWEEYAGIIVLGLSSFLLFLIWKSIIQTTGNCKSGIILQCSYLPIIAVVFNLNQWEILSLQFSFAFMIRVLCYILFYVLFDYSIRRKYIKLYKHFGLCGFFAGIMVCSLSQLYFTGLLIVAIIVLMIAYFYEGYSPKELMLSFLCFIAPVLLSLLLYFYNLPMGEAGSSFDEFVLLLKNGQFFIGVLYMLLAGLFPQTILQTMSVYTILVLGIITICIVLYAIYSFFKFNMHQVTYLPAFLVGYGLINIPIIMYGRASKFDLFYLTSSRYVCETNLIWIGCLLIFGYSFFNTKTKRKKILLKFCMIIIIVAVLKSDYTEMVIAPHRGAYKDSLLSQMNEEVEMNEDTIKLFQSSPELVRSGIELMKQYDLNIYDE